MISNLSESLGDSVSDPKFSTWCNTVESGVGIQYPENDTEIIEIINDAVAANHTIRVVGATHSAPGIVTGGSDWPKYAVADTDKQTVISLFKYQPDTSLADPWDRGDVWTLNSDGLDPNQHDNVNEASGPWVRILAGQTYLDLYQEIRPHGYFLGNQTAGWFFTIGGTVSAPVHGGVFGGDMLNRYVTVCE